MTTPEIDSLLQTCAQLDPDYRKYIDGSQCNPEQKERVAAIGARILNELEEIRRELLEIAKGRVSESK